MSTPVLTAPPPLPVERSASGVEQFSFRGSGGEYFRIWIVNLLLTVVTLGIYSAWAKVRRLRYFYGNTELAGSSFEYHGDPVKILKGRLLSLLLIVPYYVTSLFSVVVSLVFLVLLVVAVPFIVVKSCQFRTRMSSWRGIRFDFAGTYGQAARIFLGLPLLLPFTFGLLAPYMMFAQQRFTLGECKFGSTPVWFGARAGDYYRAYLAGIAAALGMGFAILLIGAAAYAAVAAVPLFASWPADARQLAPILLMGVLGAIAALLAVSIVRARVTNATYGELFIGGNAIQCEVSALSLASLYFTNAIGIALTLGLFAPWARVRMVRYQLERMQIQTTGRLDDFVAGEATQVTVTGAELGDLLDLDFGF